MPSTNGGPQPRVVVAGAGALHLHDVGAEIGQDLSSPGASQNARKLKDSQPRKRSCHRSLHLFRLRMIWSESRYPLFGIMRYCSLISAALMIGHHFSISARWNLSKAPGVSWSLGKTSLERSSSRLRIVASSSALTAASLSLAMISFGVPLGAQSACQNVK